MLLALAVLPGPVTADEIVTKKLISTRRLPDGLVKKTYRVEGQMVTITGPSNARLRVTNSTDSSFSASVTAGASAPSHTRRKRRLKPICLSRRYDGDDIRLKACLRLRWRHKPWSRRAVIVSRGGGSAWSVDKNCTDCDNVTDFKIGANFRKNPNRRGGHWRKIRVVRWKPRGGDTVPSSCHEYSRSIEFRGIGVSQSQTRCSERIDPWLIRRRASGVDWDGDSDVGEYIGNDFINIARIPNRVRRFGYKFRARIGWD